MYKQLKIETRRAGLLEITEKVQDLVRQSQLSDGLCCVFVCHTSASLIIQENADSSAKHDLERWLARLVPENDPLYTHTSEGADDMPAHLKAALTNTSITIPVHNSRLTLGSWQGIYLWEHRHGGHSRSVIVQIMGS